VWGKIQNFFRVRAYKYLWKKKTGNVKTKIGNSTIYRKFTIIASKFYKKYFSFFEKNPLT